MVTDADQNGDIFRNGHQDTILCIWYTYRVSVFIAPASDFFKLQAWIETVGKIEINCIIYRI